MLVTKTSAASTRRARRRSPTLLGREVDHDAALVAVVELEQRVGGQVATEHPLERAGGVPVGRLDLDHVGAPVGEDAAGRRDRRPIHPSSTTRMPSIGPVMTSHLTDNVAAVPDRTPVIAGIGLSDYPKAPHLDAIGHHVQAMQRALADCGRAQAGHRRLRDASGWSGGDDAPSMAEYLGIDHRFIDGTHDRRVVVRVPRPARGRGDPRRACATRCSSPTGRTTCPGWAARSAPAGSMQRGQRVGGPAQFEAPYGNTLVGAYAMAARRHMHEFGTTSEQLAEIAVGVREYAGLNPRRHVPRSDHRRRRRSPPGWSPTRSTSSTAA